MIGDCGANALGALAGWALFGSLAFAWGENEQLGVPLDSVDPFTAVAGVRYRNQRTGWGGEFRGRYVAHKDRVSDPTFALDEIKSMMQVRRGGRT